MLTAAPEPSSESPSDRVFQFISDPRHKENLSGRVRAACITCRRKKIKCSGEINCRTCQEKGLVCEGLPERKRPKRDSVDLGILDPLPAGVEQARRQSAGKKFSPKQRPTSLLRLANVTKSQDSGYDSLSPATSGPAQEPMLDTASVGVEDARKGPQLSAAPFRVDIWETGAGGGHVAGTQNDAADQIGPSDLTRDPSHTIAGGDRSTTEESSLAHSDISWWNNPRRIEPQNTNLPTAARVLFGESPQLPHSSKFPKPKIDLDGMPFEKPQTPNTIQESASHRRQSVQLPLSARPSQFDVLANQPGIFDDMALLLAARAPATPIEFSSWWDMNTDLTAMLSQAGEVVKDGGGQIVEGRSELANSGISRREPSSPIPKKRPVAGNFYW